MIDEDKREHFYSKTMQNYKNFKKSDFKTVLKDKIFGDGKDKLTFKYQIVNKKESNQIKHNESQHTMNLQRSNYIIIDQDVNDLLG